MQSTYPTRYGMYAPLGILIGAKDVDLIILMSKSLEALRNRPVHSAVQ